MTSRHPSPVRIFRLWQTFLDNVNPLIKIFHAPTVQQTILDASGDLEKVSRPTEALMFSIYFIAVISMSNADCQSTFGEPRQGLVAKYCHAAQQALLNAKFLRSLNILTLQALVIYVVSCVLFYLLLRLVSNPRVGISRCCMRQHSHVPKCGEVKMS